LMRVHTESAKLLRDATDEAARLKDALERLSTIN